jgi:hypothetical protein
MDSLSSRNVCFFKKTEIRKQKYEKQSCFVVVRILEVLCVFTVCVSVSCCPQAPLPALPLIAFLPPLPDQLGQAQLPLLSLLPDVTLYFVILWQITALIV